MNIEDESDEIIRRLKGIRDVTISKDIYFSTNKPSSPIIGTVYFDTSTHNMKIYDGHSWLDF